MEGVLMKMHKLLSLLIVSALSLPLVAAEVEVEVEVEVDIDDSIVLAAAKILRDTGHG